MNTLNNYLRFFKKYLKVRTQATKKLEQGDVNEYMSYLMEMAETRGLAMRAIKS